MTNTNQHTGLPTARPIHKMKGAAALVFSALALSSCYVEVVPSDHYVGSTNDHDVTQYNTAFLVEAAMVPLALSAESPYMVIDPDAYTTPQARTLTRAAVIETTYAYLFEDQNCTYGGYTQSEVEADTTSYDDGFTFVSVDLNAEAYNCEMSANNRVYVVNSDVRYDVTGEYDDWENELSELTAKVTGSAQIEYRDELVSHTNISVTVSDISATDFDIQASSRLLLDDGIYVENTNFTTRSNVHWYLGDDRPHQGKVQIKDGNDWVTLSFDASGVLREDSSGYLTYWYWSQLGY